jgi:hypothetical protein
LAFPFIAAHLIFIDMPVHFILWLLKIYYCGSCHFHRHDRSIFILAVQILLRLNNFYCGSSHFHRHDRSIYIVAAQIFRVPAQKVPAQILL